MNSLDRSGRYSIRLISAYKSLRIRPFASKAAMTEGDQDETSLAAACRLYQLVSSYRVASHRSAVKDCEHRSWNQFHE